jgi:hypothetical protein
MTDDMNRTEATLLLAFGLATQVHAGRVAAEAKYPPVAAADMRAIAMHIEDTLTAVIVGLREPGPMPTPEEIAETMRLVAMGAVLAILGEPPARTPDVVH